MDKYGVGIDNKIIQKIKNRMPNNIEKKNIDGGNRQNKQIKFMNYLDYGQIWNWN